MSAEGKEDLEPEQLTDQPSDIRSRKMTEKGLMYHRELTLKKRNQAYSQADKKSKQIQSVLIEDLSYKELHLMFAHWMSLYEHFLDAQEDYNSLLEEGEEWETDNDWFESKKEQFQLFQKRVDTSLSTLQQQTLSVRSRSIRSGTVKSSSSAISSVRLKEDQRKAELEVKAASLYKKQQLQKAQLQLKQEEEEFDIKEQIEISNAKTRVIDAFDEQDARSNPWRHVNVIVDSGAQVESSVCGDDRRETYRADNHLGQTTHVANDQRDAPRLGDGSVRQTEPVSNNQPKNPHVANNDCINPRTTQRVSYVPQDFKGADEVMTAVVQQLRKPPSDVKKFSGDPMDYRRFLRQFNSKVVANTSNNEERMNYLDHFTDGEANKIVLGYSCLDGDQGYPAALAEFERRYGDNEIIAEAYVRKVLEWPHIKYDDPKGLDRFSIFLTECRYAVESMQAVRVLDYPENLRKVVNKLPSFMHDKWRNIVFSTKERGLSVSFEQLAEFIKREAHKANDPTFGRDAIGRYSDQVPKGPVQRPKRTKSFATVKETVKETNNVPGRTDVKSVCGNAFAKPCIYCKNVNHSLDNCASIKTLPSRDRTEFLKTKGFCWGCLKGGHQRWECRNKATCQECQGRHPTILHRTRDAPSSELKASSASFEPQASGHGKSSNFAEPVCLFTGAGECTMAIIPVRVKVKNKIKVVDTYAFMDPGSSVSFCSNRLIEQLGAGGKQVKITLDTMGVPHTMNSTIINNLEVYNMELESVVALPQVYSKQVMPVSHDHIPTQEDINIWPHLCGVTLPKVNADIGLLIGNNVPDAYTPLEVLSGPRGSPHATRTSLGWIAWNVVRNGSPHSFPVNKASIAVIELLEEQQHWDTLLRKSIDQDFPERIIDDKREYSREDVIFLEKVNASMKLVDGHYEISLPFRRDDVHLPDNKEPVIRRLRSLKLKLNKNPQFCQDYQDFMSRIIDKGYAELVPEQEVDRGDGKVWYVPHHGVYHPKKPDKIRIVFDCAASHQGVSLNTVLIQGPNLTNDIISVLSKFREEEVAIMADIESMFYQVQVPKSDRDCLRFYWWPDGDMDQDPAVYRMTVHLFGAVSSPACCNVALHQTAIDNSCLFDGHTCDAIRTNFYVDDFLKSLQSEDEAVSLVGNLKKLCLKGGFNLTKWVSNSRQVLESVPVEDRHKEIRQLDLDCEKLPVERALGVIWTIESDTLGFRIQVKNASPTRRNILSIVSSLYDPLGFASAFALTAKILLQDLCRRGVEWDEEVTGSDLKIWHQWLTDLPHLEALVIQRCLKPKDFGEVKSCQIHHFSDASQKGYGTVSYIRLENNKGEVHCSLFLAKARVAPLKKFTIPRLELTAATVAVRMQKLIQSKLEYHIDNVYFWTDSMTVLRYIANQTQRFHTFVANRLAIIHEGSEILQWRFVEGTSNVADHASRGQNAMDLVDNAEWREGPKFLKNPPSQWPHSPEMSCHIPDDDTEVKQPVNAAISAEMVDNPIERLLAYPSSWMKLKRLTGWLLLAKSNLRSWAQTRKHLAMSLYGKQPRDTLLKTVEEEMKRLKSGAKAQSNSTVKSIMLPDSFLIEAEYAIYRYVQHDSFKDEIEVLESVPNASQKLKKSSTLYKLDPIMDGGILKVGGRLERAALSYDAKHPIILPKNSCVSKLIIVETHRAVGHLGRNTMLTHLRQKFWIIGASAAIKKSISKCVICRKYMARSCKQRMADLPLDRLTPDEPPFTRVGMDYFGPFEVKRGRVMVKRYGVVFTCLAVRAVHLEVAYSLDTDSCINAIRRFISRRGPVKFIRSDNGTNLVGAHRELQREIHMWNQAKFHETLQKGGIAWEFNPPTASHFGGVWERIIRSVRKIMYSLCQEQSLHFDDEGLQTLFCEVEAILNGRPITKASEDPNDLEALTPNHILLLQPGENLPCGTFSRDDCYARRRWRQIQFLAEMFWKRWSREYLTLLQSRQKWIKPQRNISIGDIVLVIDSSAPRNSWSLARVLKVITDKKGLVRIADVKTKSSVLTRPVSKLCLIVESDI